MSWFDSPSTLQLDGANNDIGELRPREGNTCTYTSPLGKGDPSSTERVFQEPERDC